MAELPRAAKVPGIGSEYNAFLYATIGADPNGSSLSVLSAIARMNIDPWQEAADLAVLPVQAAARRLAALIAAMPVKPSVSSESETIAVRLIKLLPRQSAPVALARPLTKALFDSGAQKPSRTALFAFALFVVLVLAQLWFFADRPATPPQTKTAIAAPATPPGR